MNLAEICDLKSRGELPPHALAEACLRQIERLNPLLNAFITVIHDFPHPDTLLADLPLYGIPVAIKDVYETAGIRTTAGSKFLADNIPGEDAFVVRKLKAAGAVINGKTNMHEIALGMTNINPHYGACRNPWDNRCISGGSSGGSAVAVATGMCTIALGSDTGGSIRIPAALCGVVGLKPTYGRVSLRGVIPLSLNLDHAGPITRTVRDAALSLSIIAGYDPLDPGSLDFPVDDFLGHIDEGVRNWHVAVAAGKCIEASDGPVMAALDDAILIFKHLGAQVEKVEMDWLETAAKSNGQMTQADAAAFHRERLAEHPDWFGEDVRERLEMGRALTSTEYASARREQVDTRRRFETFFAKYDLLLLPTTPIPAPEIEGTRSVEAARLLTRFAAPFNLAGLPALSIPCGFTNKGLPVGLQIIAGQRKEAKVLQAGNAFEQATDWHLRRPAV